MECIKSSKFTCRAFTFRYYKFVISSKRNHSIFFLNSPCYFSKRYGQQTGGVIDNCQLSDWPVRDMDKGRHLIPDVAFEVYERASYGHGCEIQPIVDEKHKKCMIKIA